MEELKKQFCTYEICIKLKELGFNEPCLACYTSRLDDNDFEVFWFSDQIWDNVKEHEDPRTCKNSDFQNTKSCCALLWQQAIEWISEEFSVIIDVHPIVVSAGEKSGYRFSFEIYETKNEKIIFDNTDLGYYSLNEARVSAILKSVILCKK